jgi:hypothetical protein
MPITVLREGFESTSTGHPHALCAPQPLAAFGAQSIYWIIPLTQVRSVA